jgi:hypothetical protein
VSSAVATDREPIFNEVSTIGVDSFTPIFGSGRGSDRPVDETSRARARRRQLIYDQLIERVPYSTVDVELTASLRYIAISRSQHDDNLHIIGGGTTVADVRAAFDLAQEDDFDGVGITVDLDATSIEERLRYIHIHEGEIINEALKDRSLWSLT